ncbi:hypothetical protein PENSPDRAFT_88914 [Peniophora sp. CONT]|nr:hypothetical protein PENSPDRAFT_88914 [Peniophora sp. CONT]
MGSCPAWRSFGPLPRICVLGIRDMSNPFVLSGLLSAWLVGPLYGTVVIVTVIVQKLWRVRGNLVSRSLLLVTTLLISSCTAHAFTYLADLIDGMTSSFNSTNTSPIESANDYFQRATRAHVLACFFLYVLNSFCNNLFVVRCVYIHIFATCTEAREGMASLCDLGTQQTPCSIPCSISYDSHHSKCWCVFESDPILRDLRRQTSSQSSTQSAATTSPRAILTVSRTHPQQL